LHDTCDGFPVDITQKVMEERGHRLDEAASERAMEAAAPRARAEQRRPPTRRPPPASPSSCATRKRAPYEFVTGYSELATTSKLVGIVGENDTPLTFAKAGQKVLLVRRRRRRRPRRRSGRRPRRVSDAGSARPRSPTRRRWTASICTTRRWRAGQLDVGIAPTSPSTKRLAPATERNHTATTSNT
jgi:hypothetical protein